MNSSSDSFWAGLLASFFHDPPDKFLDIRGHESRARSYLTAALGDTGEALDKGTDLLASLLERLPLPRAGQGGRWAVAGNDSGQLHAIHPLSGAACSITAPVRDTALVAEAITSLVKNAATNKEKFMRIWRFLPDRLAEINPAYQVAPADTRVPDHTIWNHLDLCAGISAATKVSADFALLSFSVGPVQEFIQAGRSLRDLSMGSFILSWLAFAGMKPILENLGPAALVFPNLRGNPFFDDWLRQEELAAPGEGVAFSWVSSLPNTFLALVPWQDEADDRFKWADACRQSVHDAWQSLAGDVHARLKQKLDGRFSGWDRLWEHQLDNFFSVYNSHTPWQQVSKESLKQLLGTSSGGFNPWASVDAAAQMHEAIPQQDRYGEGRQYEAANSWPLVRELAARSLAATKANRKPRQNGHATGRVPLKCSIYGSFEQMGPAETESSRQFWDHMQTNPIEGIHIRQGERFCAPALCKRFAPLYFESLFKDERFATPDTATIAARPWLEAHQLEHHADDRGWNGQWLHWQKPDQGEETVAPQIWKTITSARKKERPPAYYSVVALDGDRLGRWMRGETGPSIETVLHPRMREYFDQFQADTSFLQARRPFGPALQYAVSDALGQFSQQSVPAVGRRHKSLVVYSGGDDVLMLSPLATVFDAIAEIRNVYQGDEQGYVNNNGRRYLAMGPLATLSAGIAIAHYKEDLRFVRSLAMQAEQLAKRIGRNTTVLTVAKHSGEQYSLPLPWVLMATFNRWRAAFRDPDVSVRFAYTLKQVLPSLELAGAEATRAEITRQIRRSTSETVNVFLAEETGIFSAIESIRKFHAERQETLQEFKTDYWSGPEIHTCNLVLAAAFMERNREE